MVKHYLCFSCAAHFSQTNSHGITLFESTRFFGWYQNQWPCNAICRMYFSALFVAASRLDIGKLLFSGCNQLPDMMRPWARYSLGASIKNFNLASTLRRMAAFLVHVNLFIWIPLLPLLLQSKPFLLPLRGDMTTRTLKGFDWVFGVEHLVGGQKL
jgi:hypothetical protein